jgi:hypothetical protein
MRQIGDQESISSNCAHARHAHQPPTGREQPDLAQEPPRQFAQRPQRPGPRSSSSRIVRARVGWSAMAAATAQRSGAVLPAGARQGWSAGRGWYCRHPSTGARHGRAPSRAHALRRLAFDLHLPVEAGARQVGQHCSVVRVGFFGSWLSTACACRASMQTAGSSRASSCRCSQFAIRPVSSTIRSAWPWQRASSRLIASGSVGVLPWPCREFRV